MMTTPIYLHSHCHYSCTVDSFALSLTIYPERIFVIDEFSMQASSLYLIIRSEVADLRTRFLLLPSSTTLGTSSTLMPMPSFRQGLRVVINLVIYTCAKLFVLAWVFWFSLEKMPYY